MKEKITRMSLDEAHLIDKTDLERLLNLKDEDINTSDIPELGDWFWQNAKVVKPQGKKQLTLRIDHDLVDWFKQQGKGYQSLMNAVLRSYVEAHKKP